MNTPTIKTFIEEFKNCPMCGAPLLISAGRLNGSDSFHNFTATTNEINNTLVIDVVTDFFIDSRSAFEFSISIVDGNIIHNRNLDKFLSLYDLSIKLEKKCENCSSNNRCFHRAISLCYDRAESEFTTESLAESFGFVYNNTYYFFTNNFVAHQSLLSINPIGSYGALRSDLNTPYIPFSKFNFTTPDTLFSKINSISLLA